MVSLCKGMVSMEGIRSVKGYEQEYKNPGAGAIIGGIVAGSAVKNMAKLPLNITSPLIMKKAVSVGNSLTKDEFSRVGKAAVEAIKTTGLQEKGVEIIKATSKNTKEIAEIMAKEFDSGIIKYFPKQVKEIIGGVFSSQIASGKNACFASKSNKIIMPERKLNLSFFHEAGHAMNANLSKFGKILQKSRSATLLAVPIALIALCKTKKAPGEKPKNIVDKTTTFIKDNAGKLTFATFLPALLEEGLATIKGNQLAKKLLSPDIAKKVAKTNALGFSTYLLAATLSGLGIYLGTKVKDSIASRKAVTKNC